METFIYIRTLNLAWIKHAQVAELVDALVSNTSGATHAGSIPALGTKNGKNVIYNSTNTFFPFISKQISRHLLEENMTALKFSSNSKQERYDKAYLRLALEWSKLSHCTRKQVGAIIVKDGMIISDGYNGTPSGFDNCCENDKGETLWYVLHAEANAIMKVSKSTNNSQGSTLYLTLSPCKECSKLILQAGIKRVVYSTPYKDNEGISFLEKSEIEVNHIEMD